MLPFNGDVIAHYRGMLGDCILMLLQARIEGGSDVRCTLRYTLIVFMCLKLTSVLYEFIDLSKTISLHRHFDLVQSLLRPKKRAKEMLEGQQVHPH